MGSYLNLDDVGDGLRFGALSQATAHLCVDMQRLFADETPWATPWMERIVPSVVQLTKARPEQTLFTRFIPAKSPSDGVGAWRRYWSRWANMTLESISPGLIELVPELSKFVPPAITIDKINYSPWMRPQLSSLLRKREIDTLIVSGGETDVCVLATLIGAIDRGYRVILATDAVCSSADQTHDALLTLYRNRFGQQVETACVDEILESWR